jgi:hypothetical protein
MSLDLLEAFGLEGADSSIPKNAKSEAKQVQTAFFRELDGFSTPDGAAARKPAPQSTALEDDDWGDFEDATEAGGAGAAGLGHKTSAPSTAPSTANRYKYSLDELGPPSVSTTQARSDNVDLFNQVFASTAGTSATTRPGRAVDAVKTTDDSDVLFDASEDEGGNDGDDEFGDFEDYVPAMKSQQEKVEIDLLGLDEPLNDFKTTGNADIKIESSNPIEHNTVGESCDDFAPTDENLASDAVKVTEPMMNYSNIKGSVDPVESHQDLSGISIPPPSVLLSTFVPIVETAEKELVQPLASCEAAVRQQILSDPRTAEYVRGYLLVMTVCGHTMGGRKLRWKRDTVLGQSMRIGPASGRSGGMKLTTVDKTEVTKEDGEVAEVLRAWNRQVGKIKSIVLEAKKASNLDIGPVPELRETMSVRSVKQSEGGVPSRKPCILCGLKREERVDRVGLGIQDSFGEWWVEEANMHRCITPIRFDDIRLTSVRSL